MIVSCARIRTDSGPSSADWAQELKELLQLLPGGIEPVGVFCKRGSSGVSERLKSISNAISVGQNTSERLFAVVYLDPDSAELSVKECALDGSSSSGEAKLDGEDYPWTKGLRLLRLVANVDVRAGDASAAVAKLAADSAAYCVVDSGTGAPTRILLPADLDAPLGDAVQDEADAPAQSIGSKKGGGGGGKGKPAASAPPADERGKDATPLQLRVVWSHRGDGGPGPDPELPRVQWFVGHVFPSLFLAAPQCGQSRIRGATLNAPWR